MSETKASVSESTTTKPRPKRFSLTCDFADAKPRFFLDSTDANDRNTREVLDAQQMNAVLQGLVMVLLEVEQHDAKAAKP